jgi:hypothetical membrane protein
VLLRWVSLCGIVVPLLDALANTFVGVVQPHYDFLRDYVSDLAARGRPYSGVLCALWLAFPFLFGPFAVVVYAGLRGHWFGEVPAFLLGLFALFIGLCGVFRYDPASPEQTLSSRVHVVVSILASAALALCPFFLWLATRHDARWQSFRRFSLLMQAAGLLAALLLALAYFRVITWGGFAERSFWGVYYVWVFGLAWKLRLLGKAACPAPPHRDGATGTARSQASCSNNPDQ